MTQVTNNHPRTPLGLPPGIVIEPGQTKDVPHWQHLSETNAVVKAWAAKGWLVADGEPAPVPTPAPAADPDDAPALGERELLLSELEARGIEHDKRWGVRKLQAALDAQVAAEQGDAE